jgi:acylphosphatase
MGTDEETQRLTLNIYGQVQGVSYRWHARHLAQTLGIKGWVRNNRDGSVEVTAEGSRSNLEKLLQWCERGPAYAKVENLRSKWDRATGEFEGFSVRYDVT